MSIDTYKRGLNLKDAIKIYNSKKRNGCPKMTQARLAKEVFPHLSKSGAEGRLSRIAKGEFKASAENIRIICSQLGCDANFLFK